MTVLRGGVVSLDDLFGYSKLQELLMKLITSINVHDQAILEMRRELAQISERVGGQDERLLAADQALEQMRFDVGESQKMVRESLASQEKLLQEHFAPLSRRTDEVEQETVRLAAGAKALGEQHASFEARLDSADMKQSAAADRLTVLERRASQGAAGLEQLREDLGGLSGEHAATAKQVRGVEAGQRAQAEQVAGLAESLRSADASLASVRDELAEGLAAGDRRNEQLDGKLASVAHELSSGLAAATQKETADVASVRKEMEEGLRAVKQDASLRSRIDSLGKKEETDVERLNAELSVIKASMEGFLDMGSSATSRCLSCYSRRSTQGNRLMVGSDGKTYFKAMDGSNYTLGRLGLAASANLDSFTVPASRMRSPLRGGGSRAASPQQLVGRNMSVSAGSL